MSSNRVNWNSLLYFASRCTWHLINAPPVWSLNSSPLIGTREVLILEFIHETWHRVATHLNLNCEWNIRSQMINIRALDQVSNGRRPIGYPLVILIFLLCVSSNGLLIKLKFLLCRMDSLVWLQLQLAPSSSQSQLFILIDCATLRDLLSSLSDKLCIIMQMCETMIHDPNKLFNRSSDGIGNW